MSRDGPVDSIYVLGFAAVWAGASVAIGVTFGGWAVTLPVAVVVTVGIVGDAGDRFDNEVRILGWGILILYSCLFAGIGALIRLRTTPSGGSPRR